MDSPRAYGNYDLREIERAIDELSPEKDELASKLYKLHDKLQEFMDNPKEYEWSEDF